MSSIEVPIALRRMLSTAIRYSVTVWAIMILVTLVYPGPGKMFSVFISLATVTIYFLGSLLLFRYSGKSAIVFLLLVQVTYFLKLSLVALALILVFRFFGESLDRFWFGISTILLSAAWLAGEIRGFLRIRYIIETEGR
ncbi:MAG: hypothetical protein FJW91_05430 [Actinobacteria bacterium]|nr:hypothetical protein [Actinomycetota bacterium]